MRSTLPLHHFLRSALLLLLLGTATGLSAQRGCDSVSAVRPTVKADLNSGRFDGEVPFNVRFNLRVTLPELTGGYSVDSVKLDYGPPRLVDNRFVVRDPLGGGTARPNVPVKATEATFGVEPLAPGRTYHFDFRIFGSRFDTVQANRAARTPKRAVQRRSEDTVRIAATPRKDITDHFDADLAVVRSARADYLGVGSNVHVYAVPVNRNECTADYQGIEHILKRVSVFGGFSVLELNSGADVDHRYERASPMFGVGFSRLPYLGPVRVNAGMILLTQDDANPLVTERHDVWDPFVSAALDIELKTLVAPLAALAGLL